MDRKTCLILQIMKEFNMKSIYIYLLILLIPCTIHADNPQRQNLAPFPSFEVGQQDFHGWYPVGLCEDIPSSLVITEEQFHRGNSSLRINVNSNKIVSGTEYYSSYNAGEGNRQLHGKAGVHGARTIAYRLDRDIKTFHAKVWVLSKEPQTIQIQVKWYARFGRRRPVELLHVSKSSQFIQQDGLWSQFEIDAIRPQGSHQAQFAIITQGKESFCIDDVEIDLIRQEASTILTSQIGYETDSQTKFALYQQANQNQRSPEPYSVINLQTQKKVLEGTWEALGYHNEFDRTYWRANFNHLNQAGHYIIHTQEGSKQVFSYPFTLSNSLVMDKVARLAYEFFYYQRCGMEIPGFHLACHMDDAVLPNGEMIDLTGGWHDAGDYNKYNGYTPESFYALILAYDRKPAFFDQFDRDQDGRADLLDEALWGAKFLQKCIDMDSMRLIGQISTGYGYWGKPSNETDNKAGSGDERPVNNWNGNPAHLPAAFALLSKHVSHSNQYLSLAEQLFEKRGGSLTDLIALHDASGKESYKLDTINRVKAMMTSTNSALSHFKELAEFAIAYPDHELVNTIRKLAVKRMRQLQEQCDPYFGIHRRKNGDGEWIYFRDYNEINDWYVGESREYLDLAYEALLIDKLGISDARSIAENQVHWIVGRNPFNVSMMEGVGYSFVPQYHHRYNMLPATPNGAVPGAVVNGITRAWPWNDRPWLDMNPIPTGEYQCNEPWLPHNNRMLFVISLW